MIAALPVFLILPWSVYLVWQWWTDDLERSRLDRLGRDLARAKRP